MTDCEESREHRPQCPLLQTSKQKDTIHQNVSHHVPVAPRKISLIFLKKKVQLRKAPGFSLNPKIQKGSAQAANLRSQIWYPKTGKNRSREGWARAEEKLSIRKQKS